MQLAGHAPIPFDRPNHNVLNPVEDNLQALLARADGLIGNAVLKLVSSGGKRIRPFLVLKSAQCCGPANEPAVLAATAAELIHMASLVHDDIIDRADTRRGKLTVNAAYGSTAAVLTGDYLFAQAFDILAVPELLPAMRYLLEAIKEMCLGEVDQAAALFRADQTLTVYYQRIARKTGALLKACCQAGAAAAGGSATMISALGNYGLLLGYAYQITDDLLDFTGDAARLGKPIGADFQSGNVTLPVILLMDNPNYASWIREVIAGRRITKSAIEQLTAVLHTSGSFKQTRLIANQCITQAVAALDCLPDNPAKVDLIEFAESFSSRMD